MMQTEFNAAPAPLMDIAFTISLALAWAPSPAMDRFNPNYSWAATTARLVLASLRTAYDTLNSRDLERAITDALVLCPRMPETHSEQRHAWITNTSNAVAAAIREASAAAPADEPPAQ